jgi:hypothetical protein
MKVEMFNSRNKGTCYEKTFVTDYNYYHSACDGNDIRSSTETNKRAAASFPSD